MADKVTDEMLRQLTQEWAETLPDQYPEPKHPHRFSLGFHWKMRPILRQAGEKEAGPVLYRGARFAAAVLVAALLSATVAMAVPAVREKVFQMVREVHKQYSHIYYEQVEGDEDFGEFVPYYIHYIPDGYTIEEDRITEISHDEVYLNEQGWSISLDQTRIDRASFSIDTEDDEPVQIMLNGEQPAWHLDNGGLQVIYWDDGVYSFRVATNLSPEESIKVAESVAPKRTEGDENFGEFVPYHITYIPEGFTLVEDRTTEISHRQHFENEEGLAIGFDQVRIDRDAFDIDTEHVEPVEIMLNGDQPAWYLGNPSLKVIYWDDGVYSFHVAAHLSKEEIIKAAESAAPKRIDENEYFGEFVPYYINYIPEGFILGEDHIIEDSHHEMYFNEQGLDITLEQTGIDRAAFSIGTEDDEPVQIMLNGYQPAWHLDNGLLQVIYWDDGVYSFNVATSLPPEESIKVAESVAPK